MALSRLPEDLTKALELHARFGTFRAERSIPLVLDGQEAARVPFEEILG